MALTQSHAPHFAASSDAPLTQQEEQVVRMRHGHEASAHEQLELASGDDPELAARLLALEAQILARAPEPRRAARLHLVKA